MDIGTGAAAAGLHYPVVAASGGWGEDEVKLHDALHAAVLPGPLLVYQEWNEVAPRFIEEIFWQFN